MDIDANEGCDNRYSYHNRRTYVPSPQLDLEFPRWIIYLTSQ